MFIFTALILTGCTSPTPPRIKPVTRELSRLIKALPQDEITRDATQILTRLIQAKSVNPPGDELLVVDLIDSLAREVGLTARRHAITRQDVDKRVDHQRRENLYVILEPQNSKEARHTAPELASPKLETLCLLSHSDVVPADANLWSHDPWSGEVKEGYLWGRGALDMKGITALHLALLRWIKREVDAQRFTLKRRLALVVVADEEVSNLGMRSLMRDSWGELGCSHVINEGAFGVRDLLTPGQDVVPISVGEKGVLWVRLQVKSASGHGSVPRAHFAPTVLLDALERIRAYRPEPIISEALTEIFYHLGEELGGLKGFVLKRPLLTRWFALGELLSVPESAAGVRHTFHITGIHTGAIGERSQPNVVPSSASATIDIRVIAGVSPDLVLKQLKEVIGDDRVKVEVISSVSSNVSPWRGDPIYHALYRHTARVFPRAVVGPATSVGFTDSTYARQAGARAYGWAPFMLTRGELEGMHGADERLSLKQLANGVDAMLGVLLEVCLERANEANPAKDQRREVK